MLKKLKVINRTTFLIFVVLIFKFKSTIKKNDISTQSFLVNY